MIQIRDVMELYVMLVFGFSDSGFEFRKSTRLENTMDHLVLCRVNRVLRISCEFSPFDDDVFCGFPSGSSSVVPLVDSLCFFILCTTIVESAALAIHHSKKQIEKSSVIQRLINLASHDISVKNYFLTFRHHRHSFNMIV